MRAWYLPSCADVGDPMARALPLVGTAASGSEAVLEYIGTGDMMKR